MRKHIKKSLIVLYSIISAFLTYIPTANAQTQEVVNAVGSSIGLALSLIGGIFTVLLSNVTGNMMLAKALIVIFFGIFFYSELKELKPFKNKSGLAGFLAVIISLIVAYWLPDDVIKGIFSGTSPFIGFVIASFILLIARGDSGWSRFARGIAFLALTMAFSLVIGSVPGTIMKTVIAGFVVASLIACGYNFLKIKSGSFEEGEIGGIAGGLGKKAGKGLWGWIKNRWNKPSKRESKEPPAESSGTNPPAGGTGGAAEGQGKVSQQDKEKYIQSLIEMRKRLNEAYADCVVLNAVGANNATIKNKDNSLRISVNILKYVREIKSFLIGFNDGDLTKIVNMLEKSLDGYVGFLNTIGNDENLLRSKRQDLTDAGKTLRSLIKQLEIEIARLEGYVKNLP